MSKASKGTDMEGPSGPRLAMRRLSQTRRASKLSEHFGELAPGLRLRFMLGEEAEDTEHQTHPVFSEMQELHFRNGVEGEWKEKARWIKFEEDVEDEGCRWTKPFVGTLSLHALFELRSFLLNGTVLFDLAAATIYAVVDAVINDMLATEKITQEKKEKLADVLLRPHRHLYEIQKSNTLLGLNEKASSKTLPESRSKVNFKEGIPSNSSTASLKKGNAAFMKKIPPGAEGANVLIGEVDFLDEPISAFVRLSEPAVLGDLTEVNLKSRFVFILLGPKGDIINYREVGRVVATLLSDEVFHAVAYRATARDHLLAGVDEFMDAVTVLPPGEWDPNIRIEPPTNIPSQEPRKNPDKPPAEIVAPEVEELRALQEQGLVRTGRFFGGLIDDIKRKAPWYKSDFTDAFSMQTVASITFLYFASLSPIITFGGILGEATGNRMAAVESLMAGCLCGMIYSLTAGQPLALLNATGPVLVFEGILYSFSTNYGFDYLSLRFWVGVWIGVFMIILCAFEISAWVSYITRFTEENFALLIAAIYVYKAIEKIIKISQDNPLFPPELDANATDCYCLPDEQLTGSSNESIPWIGLSVKSCAEEWNGTVIGKDCLYKPWKPNVFLMSLLISIITYYLCFMLKGMKHTLYFPYKVRSLISDFAVFIVICSMTAVDYFAGVSTPKLHVPAKVEPTWEGRGWYVNPTHPDNPWWIIPATMLPASLATILMFLDQQITAVIVNRKENKLKKGCGYHLDLFVLAFLIVMMGALGLPWHVAGTVICINHVNSLKLETETSAPGDKPVFLGVREQRVTHFFIFLLVGVSVFMTPVLKFIPMPVLYGIFLYMGTAPLSEMQFCDRLRIFFMPSKYQPDYIYLRKVRLGRVHLFTFIQLACFAGLWIVKTNETISISFPLMLVIMIFVRKCLDFVFTKEELRALDAILPPLGKQKTQDVEENGELKPISRKMSKVNISNEVDRSGVWKHVNQNKNSASEAYSRNAGKKDYKKVPGEDVESAK